MAWELYEQEPVFRTELDRCADLLRSHLAVDLRAVLFPRAGPGSGPDRLTATAIAQPALFAVEYALAKLWASWGIRPAALLGHSLGELVAACLSGVFTLDDALALVALRGQLMQACPTGAMVSVAASREVVQPLLGPGVELAAHNGPADCVVAGDHGSMDRFVARAHSHDLVTRPVATSHAFHSVLMRSMVPTFVAAVAAVSRGEPQVPFVSNVTGTWITPDLARDPEYWGRQILSTVEFAAGVRELATEPNLIFLEVGPGQTLASVTRRVLGGASGRLVAASLPHPREQRTALESALRALGRLWAAGVSPDWSGFYRGEGRRRVALPGHPFEGRRLWLDRPGSPAAVVADPPDGEVEGRHADIGQWFSVPSWERSGLPVRDGAGSPWRWLVFADGCGLGQALADRLRSGGSRVSLVEPADRWDHRDGDRFTLDPADPAQYRALVVALRESGAIPDGIAHCWGVTPADRPPAADAAQALGFLSLLHLTGALSEEADEAPRRLWVITNGLYSVTGDEVLMPSKASVLGPCRVTPREHPWLRCASVDVVLAGQPPARLVDQLVAELATGGVPDPAPGPAAPSIAYRGPYRWVQRYQPQPLPAPAGDRPPVRPGGVYLVTGGLGGLGLAVAEWLSHAGARIVVTARTAVPPGEEWDEWLAANPQPEPLRATVERLRGIRERGAGLLVARADVADLDAMRGVVDEVTRRWGAIHGVFHAAGVAGGGLMQVKAVDAALDVLRPKVQGTLVLDRLLEGRPLDFMVLFGSNAANVGAFGQVDYCAANAFLDAYAHARSGARRVVTIDWGPWREVGMAVHTEVPAMLASARQQDVQARGMSPADGIAALDRVLRCGPSPQIVVSPVAMSTLFSRAFTLGPDAANLGERLAGISGEAASHPRPAIGTPYAPPETEVQQRVCAAWQTALGVDRVGIQDSFFDLGGNSLIAIQLINQINQDLGTRVPVARLYEALNVERLAAWLAPDSAGGGPAAAARERPDPDLLAQRREKMRRRREYQQRQRAVKGR